MFTVNYRCCILKHAEYLLDTLPKLKKNNNNYFLREIKTTSSKISMLELHLSSGIDWLTLIL